MRRIPQPASAQDGFTLLELLIALTLSLIVIAGLVVQLNTSNQRAANEQHQLDLFQESREYLDQMSRDMRQVGYPNPRNFDQTSLANTSSDPSDPSLSPFAGRGIISANDRSISFEGGVDPTGTTPKTLVTTYTYNSSTANGCPCLQRTQEDRGATSAQQVEVQNVQNFTSGNDIPIFRYYTNGGTEEVTFDNCASGSCDWHYTNSANVNVTTTASNPITYDVSNGPDATLLGSIDTVRIELVVQSPYADLKTGAKPIIALVSTVKVNNCAQTSMGQLTCQ